MTEEQEQLTGIYGWVSVGVLGVIVLNFLYHGVFKSILNIFSASYKVSVRIFVVALVSLTYRVH